MERVIDFWPGGITSTAFDKDGVAEQVEITPDRTITITKSGKDHSRVVVVKEGRTIVDKIVPR